MATNPANVLREMNGEAVPEEQIIKRFAFMGYGRKRARYWIREFIELDWIADNSDGTYNVHVPYRHCPVLRRT